MAIKEIYRGGIDDQNNRIMTYLLDAESDKANISPSATVGSIAYVADKSKMWRKAPSGDWVEYSEGGGGGSSGGSASDICVVKFKGEYNEETGEFVNCTCNKTFNEVYEAYMRRDYICSTFELELDNVLQPNFSYHSNSFFKFEHKDDGMILSLYLNDDDSVECVITSGM